MAPAGGCWLTGFATRRLDPISLGRNSVSLRRPHSAFVFAHQRQPLIFGEGECVYGGGALLAEDRDPRRIAVVEPGVGQRDVDLGDFFAQRSDRSVEFVDAPLEGRKLAA